MSAARTGRSVVGPLQTQLTRLKYFTGVPKRKVRYLALGWMPWRRAVEYVGLFGGFYQGCWQDLIA